MGFKYSEEGDKTLEIFSDVNNFNDWMYSEIRPFLSGDILEVGSGIGNFSCKVIQDFPDRNIVLSDIDQNYVDLLKDKYESERVSSIKFDLGNSKDFEKIRNNFDSVFAVNVLEHVEEDIAALKNIHKILKIGGRFVILVPAHKFLFNPIDEAYGHFRRYTKTEILEKAEQARFKTIELHYFNFFSIF